MKNMLLIGMTAFTFALNVNLYTCGASVNGNEVTFDVCMDSDDAVGGIQFTFDGGSSGLALTGAAGGFKWWRCRFYCINKWKWNCSWFFIYRCLRFLHHLDKSLNKCYRNIY